MLNRKYDGRVNALRACFAILTRLTGRLKKSGLSLDNVWAWVKTTHKVASRSELSELQTVTLAARFHAAYRDKVLFSDLVKAVKSTIGTVRVYRLPADLGKYVKVFDGLPTADILQRCQRHADNTGCLVQMIDANGDRHDFHAKDPKLTTDTPPTVDSDRVRPVRVFEIHRSATEKHWVEVPPATLPTRDLRSWGQSHANVSGLTVEITNRDKGVLHRFSPVRS